MLLHKYSGAWSGQQARDHVQYVRAVHQAKMADGSCFGPARSCKPHGTDAVQSGAWAGLDPVKIPVPLQAGSTSQLNCAELTAQGGCDLALNRP
jgi:hypothetical protein